MRYKHTLIDDDKYTCIINTIIVESSDILLLTGRKSSLCKWYNYCWLGGVFGALFSKLVFIKDCIAIVAPGAIEWSCCCWCCWAIEAALAAFCNNCEGNGVIAGVVDDEDWARWCIPPLLEVPFNATSVGWSSGMTMTPINYILLKERRKSWGCNNTRTISTKPFAWIMLL